MACNANGATADDDDDNYVITDDNYVIADDNYVVARCVGDDNYPSQSGSERLCSIV